MRRLRKNARRKLIACGVRDSAACGEWHGLLLFAGAVRERARRLLGKTNARTVELLLHLAHVAGIGIRRNRTRVLVQRLLPLRCRQLQAVGLLVKLAKMVMYSRIGIVAC